MIIPVLKVVTDFTLKTPANKKLPMLSVQNIEVTDAPAFNLLLKKIESESH